MVRTSGKINMADLVLHDRLPELENWELFIVNKTQWILDIVFY